MGTGRTAVLIDPCISVKRNASLHLEPLSRSLPAASYPPLAGALRTLCCLSRPRPLDGAAREGLGGLPWRSQGGRVLGVEGQDREGQGRSRPAAGEATGLLGGGSFHGVHGLIRACLLI